MNEKLSRVGESLLSGFKYLLSLFMMLSGVVTAMSPVRPLDGALGLVYGSRIALVGFGLIFFVSGAMLFYGKVMHSKKFTGMGLMAIYLSFLFGMVINGIGYDWALYSWLGNAIMALVTGALFLRWRFKTNYIDPKHFLDDYNKLRHR